jgi:regulator of sigma E protease
MSFLNTIIAFFLVLWVLIVIHELGHYWVARWCNVKVLRFSVGMGRIIYSRRFGKDQTEWALSLIPLGGYVKLCDRNDPDMGIIRPEDMAREFNQQSVYKRIAIVAAGPMANFLLAIGLFIGLYSYGVSEPVARLGPVPIESVAYQAGLRGGEKIIEVNNFSVRSWSQVALKAQEAVLKDEEIRVLAESSFGKISTYSVPTRMLEQVDKEKDFLTKLGLKLAISNVVLGDISLNGPAAKAGLERGDVILKLDGVALEEGIILLDKIKNSVGKEIKITVKRANQEKEFYVIPVGVEENGQYVGKMKAQILMQPEMITLQLGLWDGLAKSIERTWDTSKMTVQVLGKMIIGEASLKNITGPLTIADYAGQTMSLGWVQYLSFMALVSISLGVMNLLPIPMLDGGMLVYYLVEVVTGRAVSKEFMEKASRVGIAILLTLMSIAIFNDVMRLVG